MVELKINNNNTLELLKEYKLTKDIKIRNKIALNNIGLIYHVVNKYSIKNKNIKDELFQEGFYQMLKAVENFDINMNTKFSTYAYWYMMNILRNTLTYNNEVSLNEPIKNGSDLEEIDLIDTIEDERVNVFDDVNGKHICQEIRNCLSEIEYKVIKYHYDYNITLKSISQKLGIKYNEIMKIKYRAKKKITNNKYFIDYKNEIAAQNEISYLKAYDYSKIKVQSSNVSNPIWDILLQKEKLENKAIKNFIR